MKLERGFDFLYYQLEKYPLAKSISKKTAGNWQSFSTQEVVDIVTNLSLGLLEIGVQKGDKVAIACNNRPEWNFVDLAVQQIGGVVVPMYPTITTEDYSYILEHSEAKFVFVENQELFDKVEKAVIGTSIKIEIFSFENLKGVKNCSEIIDLGKKSEKKETLSQLKNEITADDLLTIIYTSGTTGRPKGVMLSHRNIVSNVLAVYDRISFKRGDSKAVSFLPLSHVYERVGFHVYLYGGVGVYYVESMETIGDDIREVKPDVFNTVPRVLEKIYDKIVAKGNSLTGIKKTLFFWALALGDKYVPHKNQGFWYNTQLSVARKLIFSKWQEALGGNIGMISIGGAALQPRLGRIFWAAGIKVTEGYGMTEASPVITASIANNEEIRLGCVGPAIGGVTLKIAKDGEVLCKGDNVMMGYYKQPKITAETIIDGWLHTGDIGELVEGKYLKITDRKKEMFKTSGGKYIAPQLMENTFKESFLIEQIMVLGNSRKFASALIVPAFDALKDWCKKEGIPYSSDEEMVKNEKVKEKLNSEVAKKNDSFAKWEKIKRHTLLPQLWSIETGELTPKLSIKRKIVLQKFEKEVEEMYDC